MMLNITKEQFLDIKKQAVLAVEKAGLSAQTSKVALAIDISGSMSGLFTRGVVQAVTERLLALGVKFDDNQAIDIFLFGVNHHEVGELTEDKFEGYVENTISLKYPLEGGTYYAGVMERIMKKYVPNFQVEGKSKNGFLGGLFGKKATPAENATPLDEPVYVMFLTDGDNGDHEATEAVITEASKHGVFWKFVGVGDTSFRFLRKLDDMSGRFIDNADFIQVNDITSINDNELFDRLLTEFPQWVTNARSKGLIK